MSINQLKWTLYDARFIKSIEIVFNNDKFKAIYMVRLYTGFSLMLAKKYLNNIQRFKSKMKNPLQY